MTTDAGRLRKDVCPSDGMSETACGLLARMRVRFCRVAMHRASFDETCTKFTRCLGLVQGTVRTGEVENARIKSRIKNRLLESKQTCRPTAKE